MTTTLGGYICSYNEPNGLQGRTLKLAAAAEEARSAASEAEDEQVGEHRGGINARSKAGGAHATEAGPAVEDLQPQEP